MITAPQVVGSYNELPADQSEKLQAEIEVFGQHLFWLRNQVLAAARKGVEQPESLSQLGTIRRRPHEDVSKLGPECQQAAVSLATACVDAFVRDLLATLGSGGITLAFGPEHAIRYRLFMDVVDKNSDQVVSSDMINRGSERFLGNYFGEWLNRYRDWGTGQSESEGPDAAKR